MRYLSLCSGIEAATVAWKPLGWKAVAFSEIAKFPCSLLNYHYPDVPNLGDITKIDGTRYANGAVDIIVGGTPCQDFSQGTPERTGLDGARSGLAREYIRLLGEIRPEWFVWENVPGCFSTNGGRDFGAILSEMEKCGFGMAWRVLDAQYFGVPQRRRRVFIVGHCGDYRPAGAVLFESASLSGDSGTGRTSGKNHTGRAGAANAANSGERRIVRQAMSCKWAKGSSGPSGDECHNLIAVPAPGNRTYTVTAHWSRSYDSQASVEGRNLLTTDQMRIRRFTPLECERLQGFPDGYTDIPGASDSQRYIALGNSMAVPVMRWIGERIEKVEKELEQC